ncbi:biotin--[acetyl-CoA-carboxylase] ligase [Sphingomonas paeninsulae]|uniref:biotin--[biotin carboxyl-carrier protein] ligase n=2 Tax=Sphingomonas paeninsulae TaxID=2319844 RepID=A0A494TFD0_SPHPE|nr:biotin--[acetyl-CoA-carboxylase] ligase [Sphingomonas paeninsulae]AYJ85713.1 biotin--[acetyl-CoA-carboxylase] ligase [Sphingomonas paeninsulae]
MVQCCCRSTVLTIHHVAETGSTNADMLQLAASGSVADGDWLYADRQTSGRGRLGRDWASPPGNLYASGLVTLRHSDPEAATLALVAAIAVYDTLKIWTATQPLFIKWPNDILVDGAKISGILLERTNDAIIVGTGVNLSFNQPNLGRAITSMAALGVSPPDPKTFLETLTEVFANWLLLWRGEGLAAIRTAWAERAHPIGTALSAAIPDGGRVDGLFDGLTQDCALRLRLADGSQRVIHAGDVFLI